MTESDLYLFKAIYDLTSGHKQVLLFNKGDRFLPVPTYLTNPNWALCMDMTGEVGYVPFTYIQKHEVSPEEMLFPIEDALQKLHADSPSKLTREAIKDFTHRRKQLLALLKAKRKERAQEEAFNNHIIPAPHNSAFSEPDVPQMSNENILSPPAGYDEKSADFPQDSSNKFEQGSSIEKCTQTDNPNDYSVPNWLIPTLIESVRRRTQISHDNSKKAVGIILDVLQDGVPLCDLLWKKLRTDLKTHESFHEDSANFVSSEDQQKLLNLFKQLWYCKNDEQQRSWPIHEDEDFIFEILSELNNILQDANPRVTKAFIQHDNYEMINLLATYYQMEPRRSLRLKMLNVFLTLCELDAIVITCLLNSVLPMELGRDIQDNFEDSDKVSYSSDLLTVIFGMGQQPPRGAYDFFNEKYLNFLFEKLEVVVKEGDEDMGQNLLNIILSFNLHFKIPHENIVLDTLRDRQSAQVLTERLIFLLNREEDPCRIITHDDAPANSVMKFMIDVFHFPELIDLFYLNDVKVLLDIIVRQLTDLLPGDKRRLRYLHLVHQLLRNSNFDEHYHQKEGIKKCFRFVLSEDFSEQSEVTKVQEIISQFNDWFGDFQPC